MCGLTLLILILLIFYPVSMLIYGSFGGAELSIRYYVKCLTSSYYLKVIGVTIAAGIASTIIASIVGITSGWIVGRTNTPFRTAFETLFLVPFFISPLIGAIGWTLICAPEVGLMNLFSKAVFGTEMINIYNFWGMVWVMGLYCAPYMFLYVSSPLKSMDGALEEASLTAGAGSLETALRITLPAIMPSLLSGMLVSFAHACSMFAVPAVIGRPYGIYVLTTAIYNIILVPPLDLGTGAAVSIVFLTLVIFPTLYVQSRILGRRKFATVTGRGFRPHLIDLGKGKYVTFAICLLIVLATGLPVLALVVQSFQPYLATDLSKMSLGAFLSNFRYILIDHDVIVRSIRNSLFIGTTSSTLCALLTVVISYVIVKTRMPGRKIFEYLAMIPIAISAVAFAIALLWAWMKAPYLYGTIWIILLAMVTIHIPYGVRSASSALHQLHEELEEGSRLCGASWLYTMRKVVLPLIKPGFIAGWTIMFVLIIKEISCSIFLYTYGTETMHIELYSLWFEGCFNHACALALVELSVILCVVTIVKKLVRVEIRQML